MRQRTTAILFAFTALGALPAAKPVPPADPTDTAQFLAREAWRGRAVSMCVARLRENRNFTPDDLETICGCTFDTYLENHGAEPLPGLQGERIPVAAGQQLVNCTVRNRPDQRSAVEHLGVVTPPEVTTPVFAPKPPDADVGPAAASDTSGSGGSFGDWVRSLGLPAWLTGADVLLWVALGILVFGLLLLKLRRRDPRNDLLGPPSSMRRGAPLQPPRRPDLPR